MALLSTPVNTQDLIEYYEYSFAAQYCMAISYLIVGAVITVGLFLLRYYLDERKKRPANEKLCYNCNLNFPNNYNKCPRCGLGFGR